MSELSRREKILLLSGVALLVLFPLSGERFYLDLLTRIMITAIFALSLDLLVGATGLVSFGHAAFFGTGGYALAILSRDLHLVSLWVTLPLCLALSGLAALLIGALSIRTSGVYFIMITLAFAQMLFYIVHDSLALGGSDGIYLDHKPEVTIAGLSLLDLRDRGTFYYFTLAFLVGSCFFIAALRSSPFGRVLMAIRASEPRARALGYPTPRYKLVSFVIAGVLAGLAGYLSCVQAGFMNPAHLGWRDSGRVLVMVILGGVGTLHGPVLGAFAFVALEELASSLTDHALLVIGAFVIAVVLFLPDGIAGLFARGARRGADAATGDKARAPEQDRGAGEEP
jgi:branched-chain amino acid transport system permease protein